MIYITGDTHGDYDDFMFRLKQTNITSGDTVIVCGDFGFVWNTAYEKNVLNWLSTEPYTIAFIDGNHEDFDLLKTYPVIKWRGGNVHRIAGNIYHLMRGQMYQIEGKSFFTFGGAYSIDKKYRQEGKTWWPDELPSPEDYKTASKTLEENDFTVDYVLTHTIPTFAIRMIGVSPDPHDAELTGYLEWLFGKLQYKMWFAGHYHVNKMVQNKIHILHEQVILLR